MIEGGAEEPSSWDTLVRARLWGLTFYFQQSGPLRTIMQTAIAATTCFLPPCLAASHAFTFGSTFSRLCWPYQLPPTPGLFEFADKFVMLSIPISHKFQPAWNPLTRVCFILMLFYWFCVVSALVSALQPEF